LQDGAAIYTDLAHAKKLNNFIAINVSAPYLAARQAHSSMTARKVYG